MKIFTNVYAITKTERNITYCIQIQKMSLFMKKIQEIQKNIHILHFLNNLRQN